MGKKILVAESDSTVQQVVSYFLNLEGFEVVTAGDGVPGRVAPFYACVVAHVSLSCVGVIRREPRPHCLQIPVSSPLPEQVAKPDPVAATARAVLSEGTA